MIVAALTTFTNADVATLGGIDLGSLGPAKVFMGQFLIVFARIIGIFIMIPFFGSMNVPMYARVALAAIITATITPSVGEFILYEGTGFSIEYLLMIVNQVLIGVFLGLICAFVFTAFESAGRIIDTQRGSNITDIIAPQTGERTSPAGQWLMMLSLVILVTTGQHMTMLSAMMDSFQHFPATLSLDWIGDRKHDAMLYKIAELSEQTVIIAVKVSAPAMISILLSDLLLGIVNRAAPQVNVFIFSLPIKAMLGIAALFFALMPMTDYINEEAIPGLVGKDGTISQVLDLMNEPRKNEDTPGE